MQKKIMIAKKLHQLRLTTERCVHKYRDHPNGNLQTATTLLAKFREALIIGNYAAIDIYQKQKCTAWRHNEKLKNDQLRKEGCWTRVGLVREHAKQSVVTHSAGSGHTAMYTTLGDRLTGDTRMVVHVISTFLQTLALSLSLSHNFIKTCTTYILMCRSNR